MRAACTACAKLSSAGCTTCLAACTSTWHMMAQGPAYTAAQCPADRLERPAPSARLQQHLCSPQSAASRCEPALAAVCLLFSRQQGLAARLMLTYIHIGTATAMTLGAGRPGSAANTTVPMQETAAAAASACRSAASTTSWMGSRCTAAWRGSGITQRAVAPQLTNALVLACATCSAPALPLTAACVGR